MQTFVMAAAWSVDFQGVPSYRTRRANKTLTQDLRPGLRLFRPSDSVTCDDKRDQLRRVAHPKNWPNQTWSAPSTFFWLEPALSAAEG